MQEFNPYETGHPLLLIRKPRFINDTDINDDKNEWKTRYQGEQFGG